MSDKRKVATDALETLGMQIDDTAKRDAIHLAVEPCIAGADLYPGQHVGIENGVAIPTAIKKLGIVDPFLNGYVPKDKKFWLIVYPRTITSLRHVWEHPNFPENKQADEELTDIEKSKLWIKDFADRIRQHPESLMDAAKLWLNSAEYTYDNSESYKDHWDEFPEFWKHYKVVTGNEPTDQTSFFTCYC